MPRNYEEWKYKFCDFEYWNEYIIIFHVNGANLKFCDWWKKFRTFSKMRWRDAWTKIVHDDVERHLILIVYTFNVALIEHFEKIHSAFEYCPFEITNMYEWYIMEIWKYCNNLINFIKYVKEKQQLFHWWL